MAGKQAVQAQQQLLVGLTGQEAVLVPFGPKSGGYSLGRLNDFPAAGLTTLVTFGLAEHPVSMYRGLQLGHELVLTCSDDTRDHANSLRSAVLEDRRVRGQAHRRPVVQAEGVWAPGYPPHLLFTSQVTCTPDLLVRRKVGNRYIAFLAAVPIDDRELRLYDRSPAALKDELANSSDLPCWPRPAP